MAAIGTNTVTLSVGSFDPYYVPMPAQNQNFDVSSFDPWPAPSTLYYQRVWDDGLAVWCYYQKYEIDPTPLSTETTPNYTGSISAHSVVAEFT